MMKNNSELFREKIEAILGPASSAQTVPISAAAAPIQVFMFHGVPENGMMTAVTYGLSEGNHPDWRLGSPELILSLCTQEESWGIAIARLAAQFRGIEPFSYGSLLTLDTPITRESDMRGFFVFAPAILRREQSRIELPEKLIHLVGMYPLYPEEFDLYKMLGLKEFWHLNGFDIYDIKRKNLGKR